MKTNTIFLILFTSLSLGLQAQTEIRKGYYENGKLLIEATYVDNKLTGISKCYFENGKLQSESTYKDDKLTGTEKTYFESGKLKSERNFRNGKRIDSAKTFYESGKIESAAQYTDGKISGTLKKYDENGKLMEEKQKQLHHFHFMGQETDYEPGPIVSKYHFTCEIIPTKKEIKINTYRETQQAPLEDYQILTYLSKNYYNVKDTIINNENGKVFYIKDVKYLSEGETDEDVESKIVILNDVMFYFNKYEFVQYTQTENKISKKHRLIRTKPTILPSEQKANLSKVTAIPLTNSKSISNFEQYIIQNKSPSIQAVETKYENGYRAIVWDVPLIKSYEYSNEVFDKLGYDVVQSDYKNKKAYRNCEKGILVEVGECNYQKGLCITMQWVSKDFRSQNKYFMFCK